MIAIAGVLALALAGVALYARRLRGRLAAAQGAAARYEALAAHLPDISVLLYDRDLRITLLDGAAMQTHGWRREDVEGRLIGEVIPDGRRDELLEHCRVALHGESSTHDWVSLRDSARRYRNVHVPLRDVRGAVVGGMMVVRDVTESEGLRHAVEAQQAFLSGVLAQLTDHIVACDADGRLVVVDDTLLGPLDPDMGPLDWPEYFKLRGPDGRTPVAPADVPLFRALQGDVITDAELTIAPPGEPVRQLLASARPVLDADGRTVGAVGTGIDVTDRRETESRLRASEERYRSVVESVEDIVFQTDLKGRWTFLNESWTRWSGIPVQDGLGRFAYEMVHPDDRAVHAGTFAPLIAGEVDGVRLRHRYLTADGVTRWAEVRASLARDSAGRPNGVAGVIEDVTERHRTKQYEAAEHAVVDLLAEAVDIEHGVIALLEVLCRTLDWDLAELWSLDPARELLVCTDAWGERREGYEALEAARAGEAFEIGDGLQGQAWARRAPIWATGLQEDPLFRRGEAAAAAGVRSALALPVSRGRDVLATILFFSREEREPDPALARLLQTIGAHLAQFLQRRRAEREVVALRRVIDDLHTSLTPERAANVAR
ncbi:MAG TPA: PAS domain S-box protein [Solirubrobacteraceae bacterium]|nr:PAS domain S-box protein [Solirubrobacteraceae bacterium]